ncbi:MAG: sugar ABC transporter substrate-binding protein [Tahibacter sp.]
MALIGGCHAPADDRTAITFWAMGREGEVVAQLLPEFERRNPRIRVILQQLPWTAAHEKLLTAFAGDALPDICQLGNTWIPEFAALRALQPLDSRVAGSTLINAHDYFPGIWDTNVIEGDLLGVPWYVDTRLLFYRKDLLAKAGFRQPPRDWADWRQMLIAIKAQNRGAGYSILLPLDEPEPLLQLAIQQDDTLLAQNNTRGNFQSAGFREAFALYTEMFARDWAPSMSDTQISNVWDEFSRGFFVFYITGPWNIGEFKRRLPPDLADAWATAPLPGARGPGGGVAGGTSLVLFGSSKRKDAAWKLVEYLSEPAVQLQFHAMTGDLPARRSAWEDPRLADDPYSRAFRLQLEHVKPTPKVAEWERIVIEMQRAAERVARGGANIDDTLRGLDEQVDAILEKRRWMLARDVAP